MPFIETFAVGPLGCNCSIIADEKSKSAVVVDPGGDLEKIVARLKKHDLAVSAIVHTHTHIDHVGATAGLVRQTGAPALIHEADRFLYNLLPVQAAMIGCPLPEQAEVEGGLVHEKPTGKDAAELLVMHTPGHTPGSVCFVMDGYIFSGDTLFRRGIGRTDLWGGDQAEIMRSLKKRVLSLKDDVIVVPGHGPNTTIGEERLHNPFLS